MDRKTAEDILQRVFKINKFYDKQWQTIEKLLKGERVLLIAKTGFGKSLCFQFPAYILPGLTIVFSPLLALIRDQIKKLNSLGINAKSINSEQTIEENHQVLQEAQQGKIKILYIAPERQENDEWIEATRQLNISMVVIDEAHCISVWGHDFRPSYRRIINLTKLFPKGFPVLATTATATPRVQDDIAMQMGDNLTIIRDNLIRENLQLYVVNVKDDDDKMIWIGKHLNDLPGTGIIYTGTRVDTKIYAQWLKFLNIPSFYYNAALEAQDRVVIENDFMNNKYKCIVATNAFGMGIDKSDIRFIIHTQIPQSLIHYYQEIGRAGRDGKPSYIILFYKQGDEELPLAFIDGSRPDIIKYNNVINAIKEDLLTEKELQMLTNLKQTSIRVILADLIDQKIIRKVTIGKYKKYEYIPGAPQLDTNYFVKLRETKLQELNKMLEYVNTNESRMKFICNHLGDNEQHNFMNCDNTWLKKIVIDYDDEICEKLKIFNITNLPILEVETKYTNLFNGVAASYYGKSEIGQIIHKCKYENGGDFPDLLVERTCQAFKRYFQDQKFDLILYVPPTKSGNLVKNFAEKVSKKLNIPISHNLKKHKKTQEQKVFQNAHLKKFNVEGAFEHTNLAEVLGKSILLIDDVMDSGATIKEIGKYLTKIGATTIAPLVIAKTVGGDLI